MITLLQLDYFRRLAATEHITQTAKELFISQTALSSMIISLEKELGVQLFDRSKRSIRLNQAGKLYLQYVDENAGVYPLTEDLKYIIQQHGEYAGWYDADGGQYLFRDANNVPLKGILEETSWLFVCCYIENN